MATIAAQGIIIITFIKKYKIIKQIPKVKLMNEDETIREVARIASGEITDISLSHAKELRSKCTL